MFVHNSYLLQIQIRQYVKNIFYNEDNMWVPLFELFYNRKINHHKTLTGVLKEMHMASIYCNVEDSTGEIFQVVFPWDKQVQFIRQVVQKCKCFRISVKCVDDTIVRAIIEFENDIFMTEMKQNKLVEGEVYIVGLLASSWKDSMVIMQEYNSGNFVEILDLPEFLKQHQKNSIEWMKSIEDSQNIPLFYEGNLRINEEWFVNTEEERFTKDPSWRESFIRGGILADWPGAGKTVSMLFHCLNNTSAINYELLHAKGSLIVLPLNLYQQWISELLHFFPDTRYIVMGSIRDIRNTKINDLIEADIVFTTFSFLKNSKPYQEMIEDTIEKSTNVEKRFARTKTAISIWSRQANKEEPIIEAIHWNRIVVDEIHESFDSNQRVKILKGLMSNFCWGISATPNLNAHIVPDIHHWLLKREKAYHPNFQNLQFLSNLYQVYHLFFE